MITTTSTTIGPLPPQPAQAFIPFNGVVYAAVPTDDSVSQCTDMMQEGYTEQVNTVRDDLGMLRSLGASTIRVQGFGRELKSNHSQFLDRAHELGLNLIVEFYTQSICTKDFDCSAKWENVTKSALKSQGFKRDGQWHPAVKSVLLMDAPDGLNFLMEDGNPPICPGTGDVADPYEPWCRTKAALSAFEGFLKAEKAAGLNGENVSVGVSWTLSSRKPLTGGETDYLYGFLDVKAAVAKPELAHYTISPELKAAYEKRWVHSVKARSTWSYINEKVVSRYDKAGLAPQKRYWTMFPTDDTVDLAADLKDIAAQAKGSFMGAVLDGFQSDDNDAKLFKRGKDELAHSKKVCYEDVRDPVNPICSSFSLKCLAPEAMSSDVAKAWGGQLKGLGLCKKSDVVVDPVRVEIV
jgi:hypothetical protein